MESLLTTLKEIVIDKSVLIKKSMDEVSVYFSTLIFFSTYLLLTSIHSELGAKMIQQSLSPFPEALFIVY